MRDMRFRNQDGVYRSLTENLDNLVITANLPEPVYVGIMLSAIGVAINAPAGEQVVGNEFDVGEDPVAPNNNEIEAEVTHDEDPREPAYSHRTR